MVIAEEGYESLDRDREADVRHASSDHNVFISCPGVVLRRPRGRGVGGAVECGSRCSLACSCS